MTYNSELKDGSDLNKVEIPQSCRNDEFCVNPDLFVKEGSGGGDGCIDENELRVLFDQVLSFFLKEVSVNKDAFRPFPPKLGDGQEADLFKLFLTVRRIGSYESVSENNMWEFVAIECGFETKLVGTLKLIYVKYLKELDQWLIKGGFKDENVEIGVIEKLHLLSRQLDGHGGSLSDQIGKSLSDGEIVGSKDGKKGMIESDYNEGNLGLNQDEGNLGLNQDEGNLGLNQDEGNLGLNQDEGNLGLNQDEGILGLNQKEGILGMNLDVAKTSVSFSRINDDDEELRGGEVKKCELSPENVVKKVGFSVINDDNRRSESSAEKVVKKVRLSLIDDNEEFSVEDERQVGLSVKNVVDQVLGCHSDNVVTSTENNDVSHNVENVVGSLKRKREEEEHIRKREEEERISLLEMLEWVANAARDPYAAAIEPSKDKISKQLLSARKEIFAQLDSGNEASTSQRRSQRMMHPSMYDDNRASEATRSSGRVVRPSARVRRQRSESRNTPTDPPSDTDEPPQYKIGSRYQAVIPEWTGPVYDSDSKWLGTRIWPPPDDNDSKWLGTRMRPPPDDSDSKWLGTRMWPPLDDSDSKWLGTRMRPPPDDSDSKWLGTRMWPPPDEDNHRHDEISEKAIVPVGVGREDSCECLFPGSAECIRFHVAENRLKLKVELGPVFYKWKFNLMGEEVSLSWQPEEEKAFKSLIIKARHEMSHTQKSRHEIMNRFWNGALELIPAKTRQKLVSYYYNVFVLRRRSYQNRVMPKEIDSDNDEQEVGTVGDRFGYEKVHGLQLKCLKNKQCTDLDS